jgi:hypothetical protein
MARTKKPLFVSAILGEWWLSHPQIFTESYSHTEKQMDTVLSTKGPGVLF